LVFSSSAPITIAMMFIVSSALERTGILQILGDGLRRAAKGSVLRAMLASALMNNTPVVIMLTPVTISLSNSLNISPSKMLIPLSFASIFGGTLTLIGTSTNILMSTVAVQAGEPEIGMF
jgi:Na+/H+ antiporter NhaD/arsenite permease-like protein